MDCPPALERPITLGSYVEDNLGERWQVLTLDRWLITTTGPTFRVADLTAANSDRRIVRVVA